MKQKLSILFFSACILFLCLSCSSKESPINDLEDLTIELKANSNNYTTEDWEEVGKKLNNIEEELQQNEYTDDELKHIGKLKAQCFKYFMKASSKEMIKQMHNLQMQMEGAKDEYDDAFEDLHNIFVE